MIAVVMFDVYIGSLRHFISNTISLFVGTLFLWILCAASLEPVAYLLMILPVVFFIFLIALIVYDQSLLSVRSQHVDSNNNGCPTSQCSDE